MSHFFTALYVEGLKIRKSKVVWLTFAAFSIAPLMAGFFMFVLKDPQFAKNSGLLGAKAQIAGEANWPSYLELHAQMVAVGGILIFGFITSWIFGREYVDKTVNDLLVLPYSRAVIVVAKFCAAIITNIILSTSVICVGLFIGWIIGLPQWSVSILMEGMYILLVVTILTIALSTPVAFFASYGRGYLGPLGFVTITLVFSQIVAATGYGEFFPWAIPAMYSGLVGSAGLLTSASLIIISITCLFGFFSTLYWWVFADQH